MIEVYDMFEKVRAGLLYHHRGMSLGELPEKLGGGVQTTSKPLAYLWPKTSIFSSPIYDLAKNLISYYGRCGWHSCPKQKLWRAFVAGVVDTDEKVASSKKNTQFKTRELNKYPI